jgi:hypothetical protein
MSSSLASTLNPKNLTEIPPPEIEDTYQDINSDEFDDYSDYEQEDEGDRQNPVLEKLVDQSELPRVISSRQFISNSHSARQVFRG